VSEILSAKELHHRRESFRGLIDEHHAKFRDGDGILKRSLIESQSCPVCDEDDARVLFQKNGGTYVRCNRCTMIYLNPVLNDHALEEYYSSNTSLQSVNHQLEREFYEKIYQSGLDQITRAVSGNRVLDVGCSSGLFLDVARNFGWHTYGTELNQTEREIAITSGHVLLGGTIEDVPKTETFDAITLWDVFEHLKNGRRFLELVRSFLAPSGVLFLQIPNGESLAARVLQEKCNMFDGIEHVSLYSIETITRLLETCNWRVESISSVIDELKPVLNHLNYENPYLGSFDFGKTFTFLDSENILDQMLGYKLQIVARPTE